MQKEKLAAGQRVRRKVLGDAYVDRALANATPFSAPLQAYLTEQCWGSIWTRDGLPLKTRSMINLAMLAALRATTELKTHVHGALRNGCTPEEISEVLLQVTSYCGAPAGVEAFRAADEVVRAWQENPEP